MMSKLREALKMARRFVYASAQITGRDLLVNDKCGEPYIITPQYALEKIDEALAEPLRNCDVGTAEDQEVRFRNYCWNHSSRDKNMECQCPIDTEGKAGCKLEWAQLPYEEEEK